MRRAIVLLALVAPGLAGCGGADGDSAGGAAARPESVATAPATDKELASRPDLEELVETVLRAHRDGEPGRLCELMSERLVALVGGSRERCLSEARRATPWSCEDCEYRTVEVVAVPGTESTVAVIVAVEGHPRLQGAGLELRFVQERARWVLDDLLEEGSEP